MTSAVERGRLGSYLAMLWFAGSRHRELGRPLLRTQLQRQIHAAGIAALPIIVILALITGAAVTTQLGTLIGVDNDLTQRLIFLGLFFELAPLLSALVVVARSSASISSELAVMNLHDEFTALRRLGVPPADFLLLPRIFGLAIALPAVTACFQACAIASGWVASSLIDGRPLLETAAHFLDFANPWLVLLSLAKSALTGAVIGIIACHQGSSGEASARAISDAAIKSVGACLVAVFVIDVATAALVWALK